MHTLFRPKFGPEFEFVMESGPGAETLLVLLLKHKPNYTLVYEPNPDLLVLDLSELWGMPNPLKVVQFKFRFLDVSGPSTHNDTSRIFGPWWSPLHVTV